MQLDLDRYQLFGLVWLPTTWLATSFLLLLKNKLQQKKIAKFLTIGVESSIQEKAFSLLL